MFPNENTTPMLFKWQIWLSVSREKVLTPKIQLWDWEWPHLNVNILEINQQIHSKIAQFKTYQSSYPHLVLALGIHRYVPLYSCCEEYRSQIQSRNFSGVYHGKNGALSCGIYSLVSLPPQILPWNKKENLNLITEYS